jgi:hypothetical protein
MRMTVILAAAAAASLIAGSADATVFRFAATLRGAHATPPNASRGHGEITALLDTGTMVLTYTATCTGLSGPGVAAQFDDGGSAVASLTPAGGASPLHGTVKLTAAQLRDINTGKWSFDIATAAYPKGEIGGALRHDDP